MKTGFYKSLPLISVIVPCYKVEQYLPKCIDSILLQTYNNLEIFLVDDGSPDRSGEICDEYAKKDSRIEVIHKSNGGLSDARNVAIDQMTGEYVTFIDSDDYVALDHVEVLYELILKHNVQMAVTLPLPFYEGDKPLRDIKEGKKEISFDKDSALINMFYQRDFDTSAWGKLYHRSLFTDGVRYPKAWLYEDLPTTYKLIERCDRIIFLEYKSYYYLLRKNSIEGSSFKPQKYTDCVTIIEQLLEDSLMMSASVRKALDSRIVSFAFHVLLDVPKTEKEMRRTLLGYIKPRRCGVMFDGKARWKTRVACLLTFFGMWLVDRLAHKGKSR